MQAKHRLFISFNNLKQNCKKHLSFYQICRLCFFLNNDILISAGNIVYALHINL